MSTPVAILYHFTILSNSGPLICIYFPLISNLSDSHCMSSFNGLDFADDNVADAYIDIDSSDIGVLLAVNVQLSGQHDY